MKKRIIGIGGGVGPAASNQLAVLVTENTFNGGVDQGHFRVIHINNPWVCDRTEYLLKSGLGSCEETPAESLFLSMKALAAAAEVFKPGGIVAGIPCNTFHAPRIWNEFIQMLKEGGVDVEVLHMINETADFIKKGWPDAKNIGLMSTTGTRKVGVYREIMEPLGYSVIEVSEDIQPELHDSIYNPQWGIKAASPVTKKARMNFKRYTEMLIEQGAEAVILGCTEIPLALPQSSCNGILLVDPMNVLARALIREANPAKLKPLSLL